MRTFTEIEEKHRRIPITTDDATGILLIGGDETLAILTGNTLVGQEADEEGWFDLAVTRAGGSKILLLKSFTTQEIHHGWPIETPASRYETHIYANTLVFRAEALDDSRQVRRISFCGRGLSAFFNYETLESHAMRDPSEKTLEHVAALRAEGRKHDVLRPYYVYIAHGLPRVLSFKHDHAKYEVHITSGTSWSGGRGNLQIIAEPLLIITFDTPVSIEQATERMWDWTRYFTQIAFEDLPVTAISVASKIGVRAPEADLYLPSSGSHREERSKLHPAYTPYNSWRERHRLGRSMQAWFAGDANRWTFRALVDQVIRSVNRRTDIQDLVKLCAAIETLDELVEAKAPSKASLRTLAQAAIEAANAHNIGVGTDRIIGALSMLRRPGLSQRMRLLASKLPMIDPEDGELVIRSAQKLRNMAAHGEGLRDLRSAVLAPTIMGVAALCVLYDLHSCGIPHKFRQSSALKAFTNFTSAVNSLRSFVK